MSYENISKPNNYYQTSSGDYGFRVIDSLSTPVAGESYRCIQVIANATVTTTTSVGDALTSEFLSEGTVVYGKFDSVSVSNGKVIAYKAA